jgi:hypothetical protein
METSFHGNHLSRISHNEQDDKVTESAGLNRHIVGDARALREMREMRDRRFVVIHDR